MIKAIYDIYGSTIPPRFAAGFEALTRATLNFALQNDFAQ